MFVQNDREKEFLT